MKKHDYLELDIFSGNRTITDTFTDIGESVNIFHYDTLSLGFEITSANSEDIQIRVMGKFLDTSTLWYDLPIKSPVATHVGLTQLIYQFDVIDPIMAFAIDVQGLGFIKLQIKGSVNAPIAGIVTKISGFATTGLT